MTMSTTTTVMYLAPVAVEVQTVWAEKTEAVMLVFMNPHMVLTLHHQQVLAEGEAHGLRISME